MKILRIIVRIGKDAASMLLQGLAVTVIICVCAKEGWITTTPVDITNDIFWNIYDCCLTIALLAMFINGYIGKYSETGEVIVRLQSCQKAKQVKYIKNETGGKENAE